jgi:hypothetical protein
VRLASPIGSAAGGSVNLSTSLSNVAKLAAHPKFVWVFNANCDGTMIYNDAVYIVHVIPQVSKISFSNIKIVDKTDNYSKKTYLC